MDLDQIVDLGAYPIADPDFRAKCRAEFEAHGVLIMPEFVIRSAIDAIRAEGEANRCGLRQKGNPHSLS